MGSQVYPGGSIYPLGIAENRTRQMTKELYALGLSKGEQSIIVYLKFRLHTECTR